MMDRPADEQELRDLARGRRWWVRNDAWGCWQLRRVPWPARIARRWRRIVRGLAFAFGSYSRADCLPPRMPWEM
ncbi:MAG TPA: hypothetical protein VMZ50_00750 [Phycisphaerae bacterium]|nr:hypothetical protein [Phycisphaerae bacterium]